MRKTKDAYILEGNYNGKKWDFLLKEETLKEAQEQLKTYNENEPNIKHRIRKTREKKESGQNGK